MARLVFTGFELGHAHAEWLFTNSGTPTFDTGTKRSGARSLKFNAGAGDAAQVMQFDQFSGATARFYYVRFYLLIPSATGLLTADTQIGSWWTDANCGGVVLSSAGKLRITDLGGAAVGSESAVLSQDVWYRVEQSLKIGTSAGDDAYELRVDGVSISAQTGRTLSNVAPSQYLFGMQYSPGANKVLYLDDFVINDDTGSVNNTWPGAGYEVFLFPASDNARATNWLAGAGATTNLWDALNNAPPTGVVLGSATNTSQVKNAASSTTENYDANLQDYVTAGVAAGDVVTAVLPVAIAGSDSVVGGDTLRLSVVSNPVVAEVAKDIAVTTATYPTGWNRLTLAMQENPTVVKATPPVMRIGKNVAATRAAQCCLLGLYVSARPDAFVPTMQVRL